MTTLTLRAPPGFDLDATARSHGWYDLAPFDYDGAARRLTRVILVEGRAATLQVSQRGPSLRLQVEGASGAVVRAAVASMLRLDVDLTPLYALTDEDPALAYARARGAGRLMRAPTVFEDVIKMLCTTNCSWSLTRVMVTRLVEQLGTPGPGGARAFPTPAQMAAVDERFYREQVRAGYRAPHLRRIAAAVASGELDVEAWRTHAGDSEALRESLLALPGIGPYAADNLLRLLGRYEYLGLDSWCRGRLRQLHPRARDVDALARRRYRRYGRYQGLAMWLELTRDWHLAPR